MVIVFVGLLIGVVFVIALNERIAISARKELLDNIHQYANEENKFRKKNVSNTKTTSLLWY